MDHIFPVLGNEAGRSMDSFIAILALFAIYVFYTAIYRLYFGPLSHIPGPRLAALSRLYEAYYDVWLNGQYTLKIMDLHKTYGPIVRVAPRELHISDPDFYDTIYASSAAPRRTDKDPYYTKFIGLDLCVFSTIHHDLHRQRRSALNPYFSMANVRRLQPVIQERLRVMLRRMGEFKDTDHVLNVSCLFSALGNDVVNIYSFARCDYRLESPNFDPSSRDAALVGLHSIHIMKHVPWVHSVMKALPMSVVQRIQPALASFLAEHETAKAQVQRIKAGKNDEWRSKDHPTIFHAILDSKLPPQEKTVERLAEDAQVVVMAGTLTTASTLELITFWLLRQPETLRKLKDELRTMVPSVDDIDKTPLATIESLPYLTAVIKEGLRLGYGLSTRSQRIDPEKPILFTDRTNGKEWVIPPKTSVSMTSVQVHCNEDIFPESRKFVAERWLGEEGKRLDKYLTAFSKGSRNCLGINLAYGELYLTLAYLWRNWGSRKATFGDDVGILELFETTVRDVEMEADHFIPTPQKGSKGIRVKAFAK
ncbi:cytochrome P450 [Aaosphaeria arxii CBS 175.79]|uniref:Cytochrome P450 n=1 Tax=Aaosphaeria arxii CBS 175.79 TaxID=1450172 RepID=A0A6A5XJK8_9PLEO|nr:cytochrome P450 [Aaosphaeria arxii CBS 175.79]KAF2013468.1 cytochrome P450 [Aaosphaeria arxii CBS 175.79]